MPSSRCLSPPNHHWAWNWSNFTPTSLSVLYETRYSDVISAMASQITGVSLVCSIVCSNTDQRKLCVTSVCEENPPVTGVFPLQKACNVEMFPFDDVIKESLIHLVLSLWEKKRWRPPDIFLEHSVCFRVVDACTCYVSHDSHSQVSMMAADVLVPKRPVITHWGRNKMAAILQTTFSNAFSWMKMYAFRLKFYWSLFLRVRLTIFQHWFR